MVDDHVLEEPSDHKEIGLRGFDLNIFDEDEEGVVREGSSEFPYLIMIMKIWPGGWISQLKRTNQKVDEYKWKAFSKGNVRYRKVHQLSRFSFYL